MLFILFRIAPVPCGAMFGIINLMIILLHSSKTIRVREVPYLRRPVLFSKAQELAEYIQALSPEELASVMHISPSLARKTHMLWASWNGGRSSATPAMDSFVGDIYSGLQASTLQPDDRQYADDHLRILSGLYGILRPLDGIQPYRLEMGYKLPAESYKNLYSFWGESIAQQIPPQNSIVNLAAIEYSKTITPYIAAERIITPKFLTRDPKTDEPTFVVVHTKIARGAFAHWMIMNRIEEPEQLKTFSNIGYCYDDSLSSLREPVFVCSEFGGKGLSMRLEK